MSARLSSGTITLFAVVSPMAPTMCYGSILWITSGTVTLLVPLQGEYFVQTKSCVFKTRPLSLATPSLQVGHYQGLCLHLLLSLHSISASRTRATMVDCIPVSARSCSLKLLQWGLSNLNTQPSYSLPE